MKGVIDVALGEFTEPVITLNMCSGVYFLCKETEHLKTTIENWQTNPSFIDGKITDLELREVTCSADRSGYVIYSSKKRLKLNGIPKK